MKILFTHPIAAALALSLACQSALAQVTMSGAINGSYANLRLAFNVINAGSGSGAVTVTITADHTITTTKCTLNQTNYTVTIVPSGARTVTCSLNDDLIFLNGADNVVIDGLNSGGNSLILANSNTGAAAAVVSLNNSANTNQIKNLTLRGTQTPVFNIGVVNVKGNSDNNKIQNCKITGQTSTSFIRNGVVLQGSNASVTNDNTEISGCEISNFYYSGAYGEGIFSYQYNKGTLITGNHFFQENTIITNAAGTVWRAMEIQDGFTDPAATVTITNNFIGGSAPSCGGSPWHTGNSGLLNFLSGIYVNSGSNSGAGASIQGNTIQNFDHFNSYSTASPVNAFVGIAVEGGRASIGTTTGNTIGSGTGNGSIKGTCFLTANTLVSFVGIWNSSTSPVSIANNIIGSITQSRSGTLGTVRFVGIFSGGNDANSVTNNLIGSQSDANSIETGNGSSGQLGLQCININASSSTVNGNTIKNITNNISWEVTGILSWHDVTGKTFTCQNNTISDIKATAGLDNDVTGILVYCPANSIAYTVQISGNNISNLSCYASTSSDVVGIGIGQSNTTIQATGYCNNNTVTNLTHFGTDENAFCAGITAYSQFGGNFTFQSNTVSNIFSKMIDTYGMRVADDKTPSTGTVSFLQNTIYNIENSRASGPNYPTGLLLYGKNITASRNKIYALRAPTGTSGSEIRGIQAIGDGSSNYVISNNFVSLGFDDAAANGIYGITNNTLSAINDLDLYYNTVFIGGSGTGASAAFDRRVASNVSSSIRNNIFYNSRLDGLAISNPVGSTGWTGAASNRNYLVSPDASALANWGGSTYDMAGWQSASGGDANSVTRVAGLTSNPSNLFVNYSTGDLSLIAVNYGECTVVQNLGEPVTGITVDFFGTARSASTPDLGAFEFATVLPLEWVDFQAFALQSVNRIEWATASESGLDRFEIERSADGLSFEKIGEVRAAGGDFERSYSFDDAGFFEKSFYRLRSVGLDGRSDFSPVAFVERPGAAGWSLRPNPASERLTVEFSEEKEGRLDVFDWAGRPVSSHVFSGKSAEIDVSSLPAGAYWLRLADGTGRAFIKN